MTQLALIGAVLPTFVVVLLTTIWVARRFGAGSALSPARLAPYIYGVVLTVAAIVATILNPEIFDVSFSAPLMLVALALVAAVPFAFAIYLIELSWASRSVTRSARAGSVAASPSPAAAVGSGARDAIAEIAQRPGRYWPLAVTTAVSEEILCRGVLLSAASSRLPIAVALVAQAVLFGMNHVSFGGREVIAKTVAGLGWGAMALTGWLVPSVLSHLAFQSLVYRRYRKVARHHVDHRTLVGVPA